jgi:hypothetical protein
MKEYVRGAVAQYYILTTDRRCLQSTYVGYDVMNVIGSTDTPSPEDHGTFEGIAAGTWIEHTIIAMAGRSGQGLRWS